MRVVEGIARVGDDRAERDQADGQVLPDVEAFVDRLDAIGSEHGVTVQAFDARYVVSRRHLERAVELADRARGRGEGIARDRGVEILLYAAGRRQIDRAIEMGVDAGTTPVVVLVDDGAGPDGADGDGADEADGAGPDEADGEDEEAAADTVAELLDPGETLGEYDESTVRAFFDIGEAELDATDRDLEALVLERVALLVIDR